MNMAKAMSHGTSAEKAEKAEDHGRTPVATAAPRPMRAAAPMGTGCRIIPAMVERKRARRFQEAGERASGRGTRRTARPTATVAARGFSLAGLSSGRRAAAGDGAVAAPPDDDDDAEDDERDSPPPPPPSELPL